MSTPVISPDGKMQWDGTQWIETGFFTTGRQEFIGPAEEYLDKDLVRRKL